MQEAVLIAFVILTFLTVIVRRGSRGDLQQEVVTSQEFSRCGLHCHIVMVSCYHGMVSWHVGVLVWCHGVGVCEFTVSNKDCGPTQVCIQILQSTCIPQNHSI